MTPTAKQKQLDLNFHEFLENVFTAVSTGDLTPTKRDLRLKEIANDRKRFCSIYFPTIFELPFNAMADSIANLESGYHTRSGFRYSGKSAFTYTGHYIKDIAENIGGILNISTRTQKISAERTAGLIKLIKYNPMLLFDFDIKIEQDKKGWYIIGDTVLLGTSVEEGLRNYLTHDFKRFKKSINDDLYNRGSVKSELDNQKVFDFVTAEVYGQMMPGGLSITLGNSITENCPIIQLKNLRPENHFSLPALDENDESTWPEYKSTKEWHEVRMETPIDVWEGDYMDRPFERGDIFERDWLRTINVNTLEVITTLSAADPAYGSNPDSCFKSIITASVTSKSEVVVEDIYLRQEPYFQFFDYALAMSLRFPKWKILLFENDFNQWAFADPYYRDWLAKRKQTIAMHNFQSKNLKTDVRGADKESRILTLVHPHQTGMLLYSHLLGDFINNNIPSKDVERFMAQYLAFGKNKEKLDGLDALATAYIMIFRYIETGTFKPIKKRVWKRAKGFFG